MKWEVVAIKTNKEAHEIVSQFLLELGALGVEIVDPWEIKKVIAKREDEECDVELLPKDMENILLKAYYSKIDKKTLKNGLYEISKRLGGKVFEVSFFAVDDNDWKDNWKKHFKPFNIGEKIAICPSWMETDEKKRIVIKIDPQMAFGTGEHETTKMCALFLEKEKLDGIRVLDAGTGSGILSIIAKKLNAKEVVAFDIDELATKVAKENLKQNKITDVPVYKGEITDICIYSFDLIVSNIIASVLIEIKDDIKKRLNKDGVVILSGIIKSKEKNLIAEFAKAGFTVVKRMEMKEWVTLKLHA